MSRDMLGSSGIWGAALAHPTGSFSEIKISRGRDELPNLRRIVYLMNSLERKVRRMLRQLGKGADLLSTTRADWLRRAFPSRSVSSAMRLALAHTLRTCPAQRRATLIQVLRQDRTGLSERSYYRARKEVVERVVFSVRDHLGARTARPPRRASEAMPIALPMVDRLVPEPVCPDKFCGPDRGRALSAAALSAEMCGEQERADALISEAGGNVWDQFGRRDVPSAFEVSQNVFYIARCRGDLNAMRAAAQATAPLYDRLSPAARVKFALDRSEVYLYEGRLQDARSELDFARLNVSARDGTLLQSISLVRKAQIALASRELDVAEEAGKFAASIARSHADIRVYAAEVLGRSSLQTGSSWSSNGLEECQSVFHALSIRSVLARHHLKRGSLDTACDLANNTYEHALRLRYWNIASRAASTLANCLTLNEAQNWLAQAVRLYLMSRQQNAFVGDDLFEIGRGCSQPIRSFLRSDNAVALIAEAYNRRYPDSLLSRGGEAPLSRLTSLILRGALDGEKMPTPDLISSEAKQWSRESVSLREIEVEVRRLRSLLCALSVLFPFDQRAAFVAASRRQSGRMLYALRRSFACYNLMALRFN